MLFEFSLVILPISLKIDFEFPGCFFYFYYYFRCWWRRPLREWPSVWECRSCWLTFTEWCPFRSARTACAECRLRRSASASISTTMMMSLSALCPAPRLEVWEAPSGRASQAEAAAMAMAAVPALDAQ
jgi:hypothetical protein